MELRQLQYAVTLAEELHFGRAAARDYITHGALSQQIARLERELGCKLFERTSRHVSLTEAGAALVDRARHILAEVDGTVAELRAHADGLAGAVRVGILVNSTFSTELLRRFAAAYPAIDLKVREVPTTELVAPLIDDRLDAVLLWGPISDERVRLTPLLSGPRVAVVSARDDRAQAHIMRVPDLLGMRHGNRVDGEREEWDGFWNLVPERNGDQPERVQSLISGSVADQIRETGRRATLLTLPASDTHSFPDTVFGVRYVPVPDLPPATLSVATPAERLRPATATFRDAVAALAPQVANLQAQQ